MNNEKVQKAIDRLKAFEPANEPYYLCYSGGKDSDCIRILADLAGNLCGEKWERMLDSCRRVYLQSGISPTVITQQGGNQDIKIEVNQEPLKLRKLTPRECFRLMSFSDEDIDKCYAIGMSDSQLYKQAGNSIVVRVLERIFEQMIRRIK